jgi:vacuolar-type H+-ATPase subunit H
VSIELEAPMSTQRFEETRTSSGGVDADDSATTKAKQVTDEAAGQAKKLASDAQDQAREVAGDIKDHARDLMDQTRTEARHQADEGAKRAAGGLRTVGQQLQALREGRVQDAGPLSGYADQARAKVEALASRLDREGVNGVASDLTGFARRRPGLFLLGCAGAGFAIARIVRSSQAAASEGDNGSMARGNGAPLTANPTVLEADMVGVVDRPVIGAP